MLLDDHFNFVFAFFVADTFAFKVIDFPAFTCVFPLTLTFFTIPFMEVSFHKADFLLPSCAVAVIVTFLPPEFFFKVTTPLCDTVATFVLLDFHVSFLFVAFAGRTEAFKVIFLPAAIRFDIPDRRIAETFFFNGTFVLPYPTEIISLSTFPSPSESSLTINRSSLILLFIKILLEFVEISPDTSFLAFPSSLNSSSSISILFKESDSINIPSFVCFPLNFAAS